MARTRLSDKRIALSSELLVLTSFLVVLFFSGCLDKTHLSDSQRASVEAEVHTFFVNFADASRSQDWASVVKFYSDDSAFMWAEDSVVRYRSRAEIFEALGSFPEDTIISTDYEAPEIYPSTDESVVLETNFSTSIADSTGEVFRFSGRIIADVVLEEGGWRFIKGNTLTDDQDGR